MHTAYKRIILFLACLYVHNEGSCQASSIHPVIAGGYGGRIIDPQTLDRWLRVGPEQDCALSPDGKYATWSIENRRDNIYTFVIGATSSSWRQELNNQKLGEGFFTASSTQYIFPVNEGLCIMPLGGGQPRYIRPVSDWQQDGEGRWLAWQGKDSEGLILENLITARSERLETLQDYKFDKTGQWLIGRTGADGKGLLMCKLATGKVLRYNEVETYLLNDDGHTLLLQLKSESGTILKRIRLSDGKSSIVHKTGPDMEIVGYSMDNSGIGVAFTTRGKRETAEGFSHWYYKAGIQAARKLVDDRTSGITANLVVDSWVRFTKDGQYLFLNLVQEPDKRMAGPDAVKVDIWSYKDQQFYTAQPKVNTPTNYPAVISVDGGQVVQLITREYEQLEDEIIGDYALVSKRQVGDRFWEYKRDSVWLIFLRNGTRTLLPFIRTPWMELDQAGKTVIGFDTHRGRHYYKYDVATGCEQKLSTNVPDWTLGVENPFFMGWGETEKLVNHVIAGKTTDGKILVYDSYDCWIIDLSGKKQAINITNGYGRRHKMVFRLAMPDNKRISPNASLLLTAFNEQTKENGFYRKRLSETDYPDSLIMASYFFSHDRKIVGNLMPNPYGIGMFPVKAAEADAWIVRRESATEAPNYYFTRDLKSFKPLTDLQPQKEYNWYTTELVSFTQADGVISQGILYKPVNFDTSKQYPVLFYYYEQYSYGLNCFIPPAVTESGKPNIPWYVSRNYLVFTPDMFFQKGWNAKSALFAVEGAARCLSKRPYVDSRRIGIMGLSMAGGLTNYIITHSNLFAAAFEGCGAADKVSGALQLAQLNGEGGSRLPGTEKVYGSNMWEKPEQWVGESPVLRAHTVTTPLLIMHNKKDGAVLFEQGIEMFTALRRLNKKVWLLQYDNGYHGVGGKEGLDLTTRMTQFFDHYLKGEAPPLWMVQGIPARLKGIDSGLGLDSSSGMP